MALKGVVVFTVHDAYIAGCVIEDEFNAKVLVDRTVSEDEANHWEMRPLQDFKAMLTTEHRKEFTRILKELQPLDQRYIDLWLRETNSTMWDVFEALRFNPRHRPALIALYK